MGSAVGTETGSWGVCWLVERVQYLKVSLLRYGDSNMANFALQIQPMAGLVAG